jgi:hypothetical protein
MKQPVQPATCDIAFVTGDRQHEVLRGTTLIGRGMTGPLHKAGVGEDTAIRVRVGKNGGNEYVKFDPCSRTEFGVVEQYYKAAADAGFPDDPYAYAESLSGVAPADDDEPPF